MPLPQMGCRAKFGRSIGETVWVYIGMGLPKSGALGPNPPWVKERDWSSGNTSIPTLVSTHSFRHNTALNNRRTDVQTDINPISISRCEHADAR